MIEKTKGCAITSDGTFVAIHLKERECLMTRKSGLFFLLLFLVVAAGCGSSNYSATSSSTITIDPSTRTVTFAALSSVTTSQDHFTITVKDAAGNPMNNVEITISYPWAAPNTFSDVHFYSDGNLTAAEPSPFKAHTDKFGVYILNYTYDGGGGMEYTGELKAQSGAVVGTATFAVAKK
jgi:hypothetical protein